MQCKDVAQAIEQDGFSPLPEAARGHVAGCATCSSLVADFAGIIAAANELSPEVEPPSRVWVALRAQLEAENIISAPHITDIAEANVAKDRITSEKFVWWQVFAHTMRGRILATASVALLVVAAGYFQITRKTTAEPMSSETPIVVEPFAAAATSLDQEELSLGPLQKVSVGGSEVSPVDASLRENLATLNTFIKECRKRLREDPSDQIARDYLASAYQQKAEILAAMMERGRSVN